MNELFKEKSNLLNYKSLKLLKNFDSYFLIFEINSYFEKFHQKFDI